MTMLHRVVFYGDYAKDLQELGDLMGFKVVEDGEPVREEGRKPLPKSS